MMLNNMTIMQIIQQFNNIDESRKSHQVKSGNIHYAYFSFLNTHFSFGCKEEHVLQMQKYLNLIINLFACSFGFLSTKNSPQDQL